MVIRLLAKVTKKFGPPLPLVYSFGVLPPFGRGRGTYFSSPSLHEQALQHDRSSAAPVHRVAQLSIDNIFFFRAPWLFLSSQSQLQPLRADARGSHTKTMNTCSVPCPYKSSICAQHPEPPLLHMRALFMIDVRSRELYPSAAVWAEHVRVSVCCT